MCQTIMLTSLYFLLVFVASVLPYPALTPLNQRHQEISWTAWLLIDDQTSQDTIQADTTRRRIRPKSVFVGQPLSPKDFPPCAEGYNSDEMGRCVKVIKLDENKNFEYLVNDLNDRFGNFFDYDTTLDESGLGPTRLDIDIPDTLTLEEDYSNDTPKADLDMAIIITPTTKETVRKGDQEQLLFEEELKKLANTKYEYTTFRESKREERTTTVKGEETTTPEVEELTTVKLGSRFGGVDEDETTTLEARTESQDTTTTTTEPVPETTTLKIDERTEPIDLPSTTTTFAPLETTTTIKDIVTEPSTTIPSTTTASATEIVDTTIPPTTTTTVKITTYHPIATTYRPQFDFSKMPPKTKNLIKFPEEPAVVPRSHPDGNYVRFPDNDIKYQQESAGPRTRDVNSDTGNFFNEIVTPESSQLVNERVLPPKGGFFPSDRVHTATTPRNYEKRPKMRKPLSFQRFSSAEERHRPIVLRFSRKHFHFDVNQFKNSEFYRSVPMDDLTYLFGYKHAQR